MAALFQIQFSREKDLPVIHISGEITSEAEEELTQAYNNIPIQERTRVILDFQNTRYINSSGIAILIGMITRASDHKQKIEFSSLNPHFRKVMDIVGLTEFVQIHDSLIDALKA